MITIRKNSDRGSTKTSWLDSKHTFSFGAYYDLDHMNFSTLRVVNEDLVIPGAGFGAHSHSNMEIISYVLDGSLEHKDSLGMGGIIKPGEVQLMRAGKGITHSEFNPSKENYVHFLQIWIVPDQQNLEPSYQQKSFQNSRKDGKLTLVVSQSGKEDSLTIHQDVAIYVLDLSASKTFNYIPQPNRIVWIQVARGELTLNNKVLFQGDGAGAIEEQTLMFTAITDSEILIFDLTSPMNSHQ